MKDKSPIIYDDFIGPNYGNRRWVKWLHPFKYRRWKKRMLKHYGTDCIKLRGKR